MNDKELYFILKQGEGHFIEFKEKIDKTLPKEIIAFSNAQGGKIFLGISDNNIIKGFRLTNDIKSKIVDIAQNCDPKINLKIYSYKNIAIVEVPESLNKPHSCSNGFYLRVGANSQKLSRDEIFKFAISDGRKTFDEEINNEFIYPDDFDNTKLEGYLTDVNLTNNLDNESVLINLGVAKRINNNIKLNNAGVLFFAKNPSLFFLSSKVVCGEFAGNDKVEILDKKIYDDGILNNIKQAINFIKKRIKVRFKIETAKREEIPQFPEAAYREAIVNAIMHRDYFDKTSDIFIEAYRNKIIIFNPGGLVHWLNPNDFGKISMTRNPIIASLLSRTIYVEKMGTGIRRIQDSLKKVNLPYPIFDYNEYRFLITFMDETFNKNINQEKPKEIESITQEKIETTTQEKIKTTTQKKMKKTKIDDTKHPIIQEIFKETPATQKKIKKTTQEQILDMIKLKPSITRKQMAERTGVSVNGIKYHLDKLKKSGKIKHVGALKDGYWKIISII